MMPANQPAWMLLNDQVAMNCGSRAGTSEKPARPRISARQTQATRRVSAFIYRVYRTDVDHRCVPSDGEAVVAAWLHRAHYTGARSNGSTLPLTSSASSNGRAPHHAGMRYGGGYSLSAPVGASLRQGLAECSVAG